MTRSAPIPTDEILTRLCKAINEGMDRFEARGELYTDLVEKHRDAVNDIILGKARLRREGRE